MEFKVPKPKKNAPNSKRVSLPVGKTQLIGMFNGLHVVISDRDAMNCIYSEGNFGKGSLSKSAPIYNIKNDDIPKIMWEQQFENESKWNFDCSQTSIEYANDNYKLSCDSVNKFLQSTMADGEKISWKSWKKKNCSETADESNDKLDEITTSRNQNFIKALEFTEDESREEDKHFRKMVNNILESKNSMEINTVTQKTDETVIVVNLKSDFSSSDNSLNNIEAKLETRPFPLKETLNLNLEEAFFLNFALKSLKIVDVNNSELSVNELWEKFTSAQNNFLERYLVYHHYKTKGWIICSGLKYGGDYLLYKDGPAYNHASYLVKILNWKANLSWEKFLAINRLVETFNKDVVFCTVVQEETISDEKPTFPESLKNYRVQEVMSQRWFPSKERIANRDNS